MTKPKAIVESLEISIGIVGVPQQLRDAIEGVLLSSGMAPTTAADVTDKLRGKVAAEIKRRHQNCEAANEFTILHLQGSNDEIVHGSSYIFPADPDDLKKAKLGRACANDLHSAIKGLTPGEFERFGKSVLRLIGCADPEVTPHRGDQGIDFYGQVSIGSLLGVLPSTSSLMHLSKMAIVGQAKHYPNTTVGPEIVRELVGALSLSRTGTFSRDNIDLFTKIELRPFSSVLAVLFSTGDFTKGARHLAAQAGLIVLSGWQLAVFLADREVGLRQDGAALVFDAAVFRAWLNA